MNGSKAEMNPNRRDDRLVTMGDIARGCGVQPSAVSNWRKRFEDFPKRVEGAAGRARRYRALEVEEWLEKHGKPPMQSRRFSPLQDAADMLREKFSAEEIRSILCAAIAHVFTGQRIMPPEVVRHDGAPQVGGSAVRIGGAELFTPLDRLPSKDRKRIMELVEQLDPEEIAEAFEWVLSLGAPASKREETKSDSIFDALLTPVFDAAEGTLLDPACGYGGFLLRAAEQGSEDLRIVGVEIDLDTARIAAQRALVHGWVNIEIFCGDALDGGVPEDLEANTVVCDPPWGRTATGPASRSYFPGSSATQGKVDEFAWIELVASLLAPGGTGFVFAPMRTLSVRGRGQQIRNELLLRGQVRAVFELPRRKAGGSMLPTALWAVIPPASLDQPPAQVLLARLGGLGRHSVPLSAGGWSAPIFTLTPKTEVSPITGLIVSDRPNLDEEQEQFALTVYPQQVVAENAPLLPSWWLARRVTTRERDEAEARLDDSGKEIRRVVTVLTDLGDVEVPNSSDIAGWNVEAKTIGDLIDAGMLTFFSGVSIDGEDWSEDGLPTLSTLMAVPSTTDPQVIRSAESNRVDPSVVGREQSEVTEVGDLIFPELDLRQIIVDERGGYVLQGPLAGIRIVGDWITPNVLRVLIAASPGGSRSSTGRTAIGLRDIIISVPIGRKTQELEAFLTHLDAQERLGRELADSAAVARESAITLLRASALGEDDS